MVDLLPYRFEPERREVDRSSSSDEGDSTGTPSGDDGTEDEDRVDNTDWCSCGKCYSMPSAAECLCCQEMDELGWMLHAWSGVRH